MNCAKLAQASFGMQCFWGAEALFGSIAGVITTRVGYAGGRYENPTYRELGDHIETVDIEFDPTCISFEALLAKFFDLHDATIKHRRQYISAAFYHSAEQRAAIESKISQLQAAGQAIKTEVIEYDRFYNAEDYHQKFFLRKERLILAALGLTDIQVIKSQLACKLNAHLAGFGKLDDLTQLAADEPKLNNRCLETLKQYIERGPDLAECGV